MAKKNTARNIPYYIRKEDVPDNIEKFTLYNMVEDEKLPSSKSFTGIGYQNFSKVELMNAYITIYNRLATMEQSYAELMVRNSILQDRLVVNELPTTMSLDELKNYRVTLELALESTIGNLRTKLPADIRNLVEQKVIEEVRKTQIDQGMKLEYQIFELSRQMILNSNLQADTIASFDEASKKATGIKNLQTIYLKMIEALAELKTSAKEIDANYAEVRLNPTENPSDEVEEEEDDEDEFTIEDFDSFKKD